MRRGSRGSPNVSASAFSSFCCDDVSASLRPSASRALTSACATSSFFSPRCGTEISTLRPLLALSASASSWHSGMSWDSRIERRARLVVVELREERAQHLARLERAVGLGEIGAVAPVLSGAEEEHLDAAEAALLMDGEHVGLLGAARVDALRRSASPTAPRGGRGRSRRARSRARSTPSPSRRKARRAPPGSCRRGRHWPRAPARRSRRNRSPGCRAPSSA